jgi:hypothetical protein
MVNYLSRYSRDVYLFFILRNPSTKPKEIITNDATEIPRKKYKVVGANAPINDPKIIQI